MLARRQRAAAEGGWRRVGGCRQRERPRWLLVKVPDESPTDRCQAAKPGPESVKSGQTIRQLVDNRGHPA